MRGTLHLVAAEDHGWLSGSPRRRRTPGAAGASGSSACAGQAERAVGLIERALADNGPQTRRSWPPARGRRHPDRGQATPHLLALAARRGSTCSGPCARTAQPSRSPATGSAAPAALNGEPRDAALAELARRWLAAPRPGERRRPRGLGRPAAARRRAGLPAVRRALAGGDLVDLPARRPPPRRMTSSAARRLRPLPARLEGPRLRRPWEHARRCTPAAASSARPSPSTASPWGRGRCAAGPGRGGDAAALRRPRTGRGARARARRPTSRGSEGAGGPRS